MTNSVHRNPCETKKGEGYYSIHVTPEEGWSYASFECNVPLASKSPAHSRAKPDDGAMPDLRTLVQRVVRIFEPGKITLTLFISSAENASASEDDGGETAVDAAQRAFKAALTRPSCGGTPQHWSPGHTTLHPPRSESTSARLTRCDTKGRTR